VYGIDSFIYGRTVFVPWNIIKYNVFSTSNPTLYGVSPWYYYLLNGLLNFNIALPLAFLSLPLLAMTAVFEPKKLGITMPGQTSARTHLFLRLSPFYIWFILLSCQPHKEERFMFPAFPLACFNAAISIGLIRGWMQATYVKLTKKPFNVSSLGQE
jgi:alpha-1,2-mannosyltransferase